MGIATETAPVPENVVAHSLISVIADPKEAQKRLGELEARLNEINEASAALDAKQKRVSADLDKRIADARESIDIAKKQETEILTRAATAQRDMDSRIKELDKREQALKIKEDGVQKRESDLSTASMSLANQDKSLKSFAVELDARSQSLLKRAQELDARETDLKKQEQNLENEVKEFQKKVETVRALKL